MYVMYVMYVMYGWMDGWMYVCMYVSEMRAGRKHMFLNLRHNSLQTEWGLKRLVEQNGGKF